MKTSSFSWNNLLDILFIGVVILPLVLASCYHTEEVEPKVYLESEVYVKVDNEVWEEIDQPGTGLTLDFQHNNFGLGITNINQTRTIGCSVTGKSESALFSNYIDIPGPDNIAATLRKMDYKTNDTLSVWIVYDESKFGEPLNHSGVERNTWDSVDRERTLLDIEEIMVYDKEIYVSGSFNALLYRKGNEIEPPYRNAEGTFKNVRVTKIYY